MNHVAASHKVSSGPFTCFVLLSGAANLLRCAPIEHPRHVLHYYQVTLDYCACVLIEV